MEYNAISEEFDEDAQESIARQRRTLLDWLLPERLPLMTLSLCDRNAESNQVPLGFSKDTNDEAIDPLIETTRTMMRGLMEAVVYHHIQCQPGVRSHITKAIGQPSDSSVVRFPQWCPLDQAELVYDLLDNESLQSMIREQEYAPLFRGLQATNNAGRFDFLQGDSGNKVRGLRVLKSVMKLQEANVDCWFLHLRENPELCRRVAAQKPAASRKRRRPAE